MNTLNKTHVLLWMKLQSARVEALNSSESFLSSVILVVASAATLS